MSVNHSIGRRFLKTREKLWVNRLAAKVAMFNITPNQISILSIISAIISGLFLVFTVWHSKWLIAIFFIQCRLFCNMLDGLVAIEGNKKSKLGDIYNDLPDRISDIIIILAFGYAIDITYQFNTIINYLTWIAALQALFTAYIRTLFISLGTPADYSGPMAKQHRMALISVACLFCYVWPKLSVNIVLSALILLNSGMLITIYFRIKKGVQYLLCH
jgi:phosphatidylglycerophosphate synthase